VADINGDGRLTAIDTSWLLGKVRGQVRPEIPDIPLDTVVFARPDPLVEHAAHAGGARRRDRHGAGAARQRGAEFLEANVLRPTSGRSR
jgi:hypothetical protein